MDFTREPIIETVITPKEGFKLVLRNSSKVGSEEAHLVSSVQIVSFGKGFFFRSLEKPKAFLLPVTDYEVLETRDSRVALKKPKIEKSIKIGGGKGKKEKEVSEEKQSASGGTQNRPSRRRRPAPKEEEHHKVDPEAEELEQSKRRSLLPPPTSLISEQISRYKNYLVSEGTCLPEELEEGEKLTALPQEDLLPLHPDAGKEATIRAEDSVCPDTTE